MTEDMESRRRICRKCKQLRPIAPSRLRNRDYLCGTCGSKKWKDSNRDQALAYGAAWREANREAQREYDRQRYAADPEAERARATAYRQANPGKRALWQHNREAREAGIENTLTDEEWVAIVARYQGHCLRCARTDRPLTRDHIVPLSHGAALTADNVQPLCGPCNASKKCRTTDYRPRWDTPVTAA